MNVRQEVGSEAHTKAKHESTITSCMYEVIPNPTLWLSKFPEQTKQQSKSQSTATVWVAHLSKLDMLKKGLKRTQKQK